MNPTIRTGSYTGTGSAINIPLGFVPDYIRIVNGTDGDVSWEWFSTMAAASAFQTTNHDTAQQSVITSNGVSALNGANGAGFTIGTALSESTKVFHWVAMRTGAGA